MIRSLTSPRRLPGALTAAAREDARGRLVELGVRPERILTSAADLFRERGYHLVGVDDIGRAAGITGPAVYRHFPSKIAILIAVFDRSIERLVAGGDAAVARGRSPRGRLERLVAFHVEFVLTERSLIAVYMGEEKNLPLPDRRRLRRRLRVYLEHWVSSLRGIRPELSEETARAAARAALGMVISMASEAWPQYEEHAELFERMMTAALLAAARPARGRAGTSPT